MRLKSISILFLFLFVKIQAQTHKLIFTASGATNTIDSIQVINNYEIFNQCETFSLSGSDTLFIVYHTGVEDINAKYKKLNAYPNPFTGQTKIEFYNARQGSVNIEIFNVNGSKIFQKKEDMPLGTNTFTVTGLKRGLFFLNIKTTQNNYLSKLISLNGNINEVVSVKYDGSDINLKTETHLKSNKNLVYVNIDYQGRLLLKAFSGKYSRVISIWISQDTTAIDFYFVDCTDADGNNYPVVTISNKTWMAENLKTSKYNDGSEITYIGDDSLAWQNNTNGAYCLFQNDTNNKDLFGALYNWNAVDVSSNGNKNICPVGWHVSTENEWSNLVYYLGGQNIYSGVADDLKATCTNLWQTHYYTNNRRGFTGLPSGGRNYDGSQYDYGEEYGGFAFWWTSDEVDAEKARSKSITESEYVGSQETKKTFGASVRCIKD